MLNILLLIFIIGILGSVIKRGQNPNELLSRSDTGFIRGVAILMVMFSHITAKLSENINLIGGGYARTIVNSWGAIGVAIFFLLSGYGNYYSVERISNGCVKLSRVGWLTQRVAKLMLTFFFCYLLVVLVLCVSTAGSHNINEYFVELISLKIPGTSTWYLKIQILMYFFIWLLSIGCNRYRCVGVTILTFLYVIIAYELNLPDYWWKTVMCFPMGMFLVQWKVSLANLVQKHRIPSYTIAIILFLFGYGYIVLLAKGYSLLPQCISYVLISIGICLFLSFLHPVGHMISWIGNLSLEIYLLHIGILPIVTVGKTDIGVILYMGISLIGAALIHKIINKLLRI